MSNEVRQKNVVVYSQSNGKEPFTIWLSGLRDKTTKYRIVKRITQLSEGNPGDYTFVGDGVNELRFFFGTGYRVYFAEHADEIIILLCGGDKSTQPDDIKKAKTYWKEYQKNEEI